MILTFPHKRLRAEVIKEYVGNKKIVCFSCGNASYELRNAGLDVLEIGRHGDLKPNHWFTQKEIATIFPNYFDATPGHLPMELMLLLAKKYKSYFQCTNNLIHDEYDIPCGSGETLVCLKLAYPNIKFNALYNVKELFEETEYNRNAPLNDLVQLLSNKITI